MLRLERVSKFYSANGLVSAGFSKVDLEFDMGEFVAITGESGSGKSTLLNVISGLDSYEEGEMYIMNEPTSGYAKEDLEAYRKRYIGSIFQTFNLINSYTVYQNVELVLLLSGYDKAEIPEKVRDIIAKVGLSEYERTKAAKLSGGQKQRVAIARALAKETPIIVADEPTGNLDSKSAAEVIELLHNLSQDKLIIIVTHNYEQVEQYVTRKISMHDGRVAEDKKLDKAKNTIVDESEVKTAKADPLKAGSCIRLGMRNTFNLPAKFLLLLTVFVFLCGGVISQYASFLNAGDAMSGMGYNQYFKDTAKNRILITRSDRSEFTSEDYEKIKNIDNVQSIIEDDLYLDIYVDVRDPSDNEAFYISASLRAAEGYESRLEEGRMPEKGNEAVMIFPKEGYVNDIWEDVEAKGLQLIDGMTGTEMSADTIKIVGYGFTTEEEEESMFGGSYYTEAYLVAGEDVMNEASQSTLARYCQQEIELDDKIVQGNISMWQNPLMISEEVPEGQVYISEELASLADYGAQGKELKITNKSLYFEDEFKFNVGAVYNEHNYDYYVGLNTFEEMSGAVFINPADFDKMFNKGNFQSSVLVDDERDAEITAKAIAEEGYNTFRVNDGVISYTAALDPIINVFRVVMLLAIVVVLFFISYFIIKLILKSRNVYFSTIRMLGASKENCRNLLRIELFAIFNIAFVLCIGVILMVLYGAISADYLMRIVTFLTMKDYIILYVLLCLISLLLAQRYSKQLFKKTAMNAYKEEV